MCYADEKYTLFYFYYTLQKQQNWYYKDPNRIIITLMVIATKHTHIHKESLATSKMIVNLISFGQVIFTIS